MTSNRLTLPFQNSSGVICTTKFGSSTGQLAGEAGVCVTTLFGSNIGKGVLMGVAVAFRFGERLVFVPVAGNTGANVGVGEIVAVTDGSGVGVGVTVWVYVSIGMTIAGFNKSNTTLCEMQSAGPI